MLERAGRAQGRTGMLGWRARDDYPKALFELPHKLLVPGPEVGSNLRYVHLERLYFGHQGMRPYGFCGRPALTTRTLY